jgi:hypothetical protein
MREQRSRSPWMPLFVVVGLLGAGYLGGIRSAGAQGGGPPAAYSAGTAVEVADRWQVTVGAATILAEAPTSPPLLVISLNVQNLASQPRHFPTYRLRALTASGATLRDTWCQNSESSLELSPQIPPSGTASGAVCWTLPSADVDQIALIVDAALGSAQEGAAFTLYSERSTVARSVPTPTQPPAPRLDEFPAVPDSGSAERPAPSSAQCLPAYSLYADSSGSYSTAACSTGSSAGSGTGDSPGVVGLGGGAPPCQLYPSGLQPATANTGPARAPLACPTTGGGASWNAGVSACQLYPSASQPSSTSITTTGPGSPLTAATSAAPTCPLAGGGGGASTSGGAPACRLYASGSQPSISTSSLGTAPSPAFTPVAVPTVPIPPRGALAGASC